MKIIEKNDTSRNSFIKSQIRLSLGDFHYVELFDIENNVEIDYSIFGTTSLYNVFDKKEWWPSIGESVLSRNNEIFEIVDILTYLEGMSCVKRFYLKKKTEQKSIINV